MCEQHARDPYNSPLRPACDPAPLAFREAAVGSGAVSFTVSRFNGMGFILLANLESN
jgi:hypothetical protein